MNIQFIPGPRDSIIAPKGSKNNKAYLQGEYLAKGYNWWLLQYQGMPEEIAKERYGTPARDIGCGLTEPWLFGYLNTKPLDLGIDYVPQQHDVLTISNNYLNPPIANHNRPHTSYIRFGFNDGLWDWDGLVHYANYEQLAEGYVLITA